MILLQKYDDPDKAIEEAKKSINGYINFQGMNCNDQDNEVNCEGWNGHSHRCQCGNRHVFWACSKTIDGMYVAYASAW
jgi:hypothetical protein